MSTAQHYFVFIGSENKQPFYVRVDSEFHSSTPEGHLILAQLKDSIYNITIGFPGQTQPEQHYAFNIRGRDQAFQLQQQGEKGLRLYDLQAKDWLSPQGGSVAGEEFRSTGIKKDDAFSRMMAGVVHDTAVLYNTYAMEQVLNDSPAVVKTAAVAPALTAGDTTTAAPIIRDTAAATATNAPATAVTQNPTTAAALPPPATTSPTAASPAASIVTSPTIPANPPTTSADTTTHSSTKDSTTAPLYRSRASKDTSAATPVPGAVGAPLYRSTSGVTKVSERRSTRNVRLVYADHSGGKKVDTIVVIIPVDTPTTSKAAVKPTIRQLRGADTSHVQSAMSHGPNPDSPAVGTSPTYRPTTPVPLSVENTRPHPADSQRRQPKTVLFVNSDCHNFATDFDVDKLRSKMLEAAKDDDRINVARKAFKVKCFSTRQIRVLNEVFTSDAARFRFLEAAWPFAADEHFHELYDLLADPVYINKFKTMTHSQ